MIPETISLRLDGDFSFGSWHPGDLWGIIEENLGAPRHVPCPWWLLVMWLTTLNIFWSMGTDNKTYAQCRSCLALACPDMDLESKMYLVQSISLNQICLSPRTARNPVCGWWWLREFNLGNRWLLFCVAEECVRAWCGLWYASYWLIDSWHLWPWVR